MPDIEVVRADERSVAETDATSGMTREQAVAGEGVWAGLVRIPNDRRVGTITGNTRPISTSCPVRSASISGRAGDGTWRPSPGPSSMFLPEWSIARSTLRQKRAR
jgi:hypothetical protein